MVTRRELSTLRQNISQWVMTNIFKFHKLIRIIYALLLLVGLIVQSLGLNYYLIRLNSNSSAGWYFWFVADFVIMTLFMFGAYTAGQHHYWRCLPDAVDSETCHERHVDPVVPPDNAVQDIHNGMLRSFATAGPPGVVRSTSSPTLTLIAVPSISDTIDGIKEKIIEATKPIIQFPIWLGTLPLTYTAWLIYSLILITKICLLFELGIAQMLDEEQLMGIHTFKILIALAAVVFYFWVECNNDQCPMARSQKASGSSVANELTSTTIFEFFDTITLLHILLPRESEVPDLPEWADEVILILASVNFLIPTLGLIRLSFSNMGLFRDNSKSLRVNLIAHALRLVVINVPYFILRIRFRFNISHDVSIFALKNAMAIVVTLFHIWPEYQTYIKTKRDETIEGNRYHNGGEDGPRTIQPPPAGSANRSGPGPGGDQPTSSSYSHLTSIFKGKLRMRHSAGSGTGSGNSTTSGIGSTPGDPEGGKKRPNTVSGNGTSTDPPPEVGFEMGTISSADFTDVPLRDDETGPSTDTGDQNNKKKKKSDKVV